MIRPEVLDNVVLSYLIEKREFSREECSPFDSDYEECIKYTTKNPQNTTLIEAITEKMMKNMDNPKSDWKGVMTLDTGEQVIYYKYPFSNNTLHYIYALKNKEGKIEDYESFLVTVNGIIKKTLSNMKLIEADVQLVDLKRKAKEDYSIVI